MNVIFPNLWVARDFLIKEAGPESGVAYAINLRVIKQNPEYAP